jgi:hypothetical protein
LFLLGDGIAADGDGVAGLEDGVGGAGRERSEEGGEEERGEKGAADHACSLVKGFRD